MTDTNSASKALTPPALQGWFFPAFLFLAFGFLETILRAAAGADFLNEGLLYSILFAGSAAAVISLLVSFLPSPLRKIALGAILFFITVLFASQLIYWRIFQTFYTVYSAVRGAQVLKFLPGILPVMAEQFAWLAALFLPFLILLIFKRRVPRQPDPTPWKQRGILLLLSASFTGIALLGILVGDRDVNSAYDVYYRDSYPAASVNRLGLLTTMRVDLSRSLSGYEPRLPCQLPQSSPLIPTRPPRLRPPLHALTPQDRPRLLSVLQPCPRRSRPSRIRPSAMRIRS